MPDLFALPNDADAGARYLAILAGGILLWYVVAPFIWPWARCWCCRGTGRHYAPDREHWRGCRWCGESGRRLRWARRIWGRRD